MLKIGLTGRIIYKTKYDEYRECLDVRWSAFVKNQLQALPVLIPSTIDPAFYIKQLQIHAIILTGGNNIGSISNCLEDIYRDNYETRKINESLKLGIPIIGVCRGMQMIATYFGQKIEPVSNHVAVKHNIKANKKDPFYEIISSLSPVNSYHDYKVSELPRNFHALAYSDDGVIEAFMWHAKKVFGLMWHPERVTSSNIQMKHGKFIKDMINV